MNETAPEHNIFLVTGPVQGGKTTFLTQLVTGLIKKGFHVGGFLSPGSIESGVRSGFRLKNIATGEEYEMASARESTSWIKYRTFWFNPKAFQVGREWIRTCIKQVPSVMVIDEVGPMELEGSGWSAELDYLKSTLFPVQLWSVREGIVQEVKERWDIPSGQLIRIENMNWEQALEQISALLDQKKK